MSSKSKTSTKGAFGKPGAKRKQSMQQWRRIATHLVTRLKELEDEVKELKAQIAKEIKDSQ